MNHTAAYNSQEGGRGRLRAVEGGRGKHREVRRFTDFEGPDRVVPTEGAGAVERERA